VTLSVPGGEHTELPITFTVRESQDPEWLSQAEGGQKLDKGRELLEAIVAELEVPARFVLAQGRRFPGEAQPRFCLGAEWTRGARGKPTATASAALAGALESAPQPDPERAWLAVTPTRRAGGEPAAVSDLEKFLALSEAAYRAAAAVGLSSERFRFNGEATDSGEVGRSPWAVRGRRAVRSSSSPGSCRHCSAICNSTPHSPMPSPESAWERQPGPRPDEGVRERFEELAVSLDRLESRGKEVRPEELWGSLAPLLVDASGNTHRAEVNVEKLWNPGLGPRGLAGLVELRALRMPRSSRQLVAVAALFRSICARLATSPAVGPLREWGASLHEKWALPFYLEEDLQGVLDDLSLHGVGLGPQLTAALLERAPPLWIVRAPGVSLEVREALEFWSLLGDVASQASLTARLVDPSTRRLEVRLTLEAGTPRDGSAPAAGRCHWSSLVRGPAGRSGGGGSLPRLRVNQGCTRGCCRTIRWSWSGTPWNLHRHPAARLEAGWRSLPGSAPRCRGGAPASARTGRATGGSSGRVR
jgi:hypothetical protein